MTGDISSIRWRPFELELIDSFSAGSDVVSTKRGVVEIDCEALERVAMGPWQEIYYA